MSKCHGSIDIEVEGEEITLSLPMENLERIESLTGIGMLKLLSMAETNDLTITNAALIFRIATSKEMSKKQVYAWITEVGVVKLFEVLTELLSETFDQDIDEDEDSEPGK